MCLGIDVLSCNRATGQDSGVHEEQTRPLALAWPYTVCVCPVLQVLISGGYPPEMNRWRVSADNVCLDSNKCHKFVVAGKIRGFFMNSDHNCSAGYGLKSNYTLYNFLEMLRLI